MTEPQLTTLAARTGTALGIAKGESLKIVNTHGTQVVDFWAFNAVDIDEWMSMPHTRNACRKLTPAVGETFVTTLRRPIVTLDEDTSPGVQPSSPAVMLSVTSNSATQVTPIAQPTWRTGSRHSTPIHRRRPRCSISS